MWTQRDIGKARVQRRNIYKWKLLIFQWPSLFCQVKSLCRSANSSPDKREGHRGKPLRFSCSERLLNRWILDKYRIPSWQGTEMATQTIWLGNCGWTGDVMVWGSDYHLEAFWFTRLSSRLYSQSRAKVEKGKEKRYALEGVQRSQAQASESFSFWSYKMHLSL